MVNRKAPQNLALSKLKKIGLNTFDGHQGKKQRLSGIWINNRKKLPFEHLAWSEIKCGKTQPPPQWIQ
jgi:hypothetical protein